MSPVRLPPVSDAEQARALEAFTEGDRLAAGAGIQFGLRHHEANRHRRCRCLRCVGARFFAYLILSRDQKAWPLLKIAAAFGKADHHGILYGIQEASKLRPDLLKGSHHAHR